MRKIASLLVGLILGIALGAALTALFSQLSSDELQAHYQRALAAGRRASAARRAELEKELRDLREA